MGILSNRVYRVFNSLSILRKVEPKHHITEEIAVATSSELAFTQFSKSRSNSNMQDA